MAAPTVAPPGPLAGHEFANSKGTLPADLARAAFQLGSAEPQERGDVMRSILEAHDPSSDLYAWLVEQMLQASPGAAAAARGLEAVDGAADLDPACMVNRLTDAERRQFETQGFLVRPLPLITLLSACLGKPGSRSRRGRCGARWYGRLCSQMKWPGCCTAQSSWTITSAARWARTDSTASTCWTHSAPPRRWGRPDWHFPVSQPFPHTKLRGRCGAGGGGCACACAARLPPHLP